MEQEEKFAPTWFYGLVGVAAVGGISMLLLASVMLSSPPDRIEMTSVTPPQEIQAQ